jgi:predicted transcriptional regulator
MEKIKREEKELNKIELKILDFLKISPLSATTTIAFNVQANFFYVRKYLEHLEQLGYVEINEDFKKSHKHFTFWRLKNVDEKR